MQYYKDTKFNMNNEIQNSKNEKYDQCDLSDKTKFQKRNVKQY